MTAYDDIMREYREFKRYTGDNLPGAPVNAPLPVGDPQSGPWNPKKSALRLALGNLAQELLSGITIVNGAIPAINAARDAALAAIEPLVGQAEAARDIAAGYASDAVSQGNVPIYATAVGIAALNIPAGINAFRTNGHHKAGDWGAALYREKVVLEADQPGDLASNGATKRWALAMPSVNPVMYGAKGDYYENGTDDHAALQAALNSGLNVLIPAADFGTSRPLIGRTHGQMVGGLGFGGGAEQDMSTVGLSFRAVSRIVAFGTAAKRVMTRRLPRLSAADPKDSPMSAVIDIEAEGVIRRGIRPPFSG